MHFGYRIGVVWKRLCSGIGCGDQRLPEGKHRKVEDLVSVWVCVLPRDAAETNDKGGIHGKA